MIEIKQLDFRYSKAGFPLFEGLNLDLQPGSIYGLLGRNGAGKTTLLKIMCGLLYPNKGTCTINGIQSSNRNPLVYADLFFIPEDLVAPDISGKEFIAIYKGFYPNYDAGVMKSLVSEYGLEIRQNLKKMSYGQRKKFFLAFGLASNVKLLILDEPTNGLDIPSKSQFRKMVSSQMTDDKIIIISTHQVRDLESMIDPIVIVESGKIVFNQSVEEIQKKLRFEDVKSNESRADSIYEETTSFGGSRIVLNEDGTPSAVDSELLFNAVVTDSTRITNLFN
ncbi:MAG: ABC transporter ATP-binding protein [Bacteroidales bacterium]|nr:ABC transporter ATP-binding protein [Bacteroidales bacterium]